ncbi:MAG TPA: PQQ-binding-like beta-propeller repeat protein, partial [Planctomycetia bacterium]|nr:PQQ-binding-like beta-propeller repeat protein [Planctomycetia bacterium]
MNGLLLALSLAGQIDPGIAPVERLGSPAWRGLGFGPARFIGPDRLRAVCADGIAEYEVPSGKRTLVHPAAIPAPEFRYFSRDLSLMLVPAKNGGADLWRLDPPRVARNLPIPLEDYYESAALKGDRIVSAAGPRGQRMFSAWDATVGKLLWRKALPDGEFVLSDDGRWLAIGSDEHVRTYDAATGRETGHSKGKVLYPPAFAPRSSEFWFRGSERLLALDAAKGDVRPVANIECVRLTFAEDGTALVEGEKESFLLAADRQHPGPPVKSLSLREYLASPKGRWILGLDYLESQRLWDGERRTWSTPQKDSLPSILELDATPDGKTIVARTGSGEVVFWDRPTGQVRARFAGRSPSFPERCGLSVSVEGQRATAAGEVFDRRTGKERGDSNALMVLPDGRGTVSLGRPNNRETVFIEREGPKEKLAFESPDDRFVAKARLSPNGRRLALARHQHGFGGANVPAPVRVIDTKSGFSWSVPAPGFELAFSADGSLVAAGDQSERSVWVFSAQPGAKARRIEAGAAMWRESSHRPYIADVAFVENGISFVDSDTGAVCVAELESGRIIKSLSAAQAGSAIHCIASLDRGKRIAIGHGDGSVSIWDVAKLPVVPATVPPGPPRIDGDGDPLPSFAIRRIGSRRFRVPVETRDDAIASRDGRRLACTNQREYLIIDVKGGRRLHSWPKSEDVRRQEIAFSSDGRWLAATVQGGFRLFDAE